MILLAACTAGGGLEPAPRPRDSAGETGETGETGDTGVRAGEARATFTGAVATTDGWLGWSGDELRDQPVTGSITWATSGRDDDDRSDFGSYDRAGRGMTVELAGHVVEGSGAGRVEIQDYTLDAFSFIDGDEEAFEDWPIMRLDGEETEDLGVYFAIVDDDGSSLDGDGLPATFPFLEPRFQPHTFAIRDDDGYVLLQLDAIEAG
jgi:hypothetical protein